MELTAQAIRFGYTEKAVLDEIDVHLQPGKFTALIGPNGAGKSTLIRILAGLLKPWSGLVRVGEQVITHLPANERARRVAYLPQRVSEAAGYKVEEIVALGRFPHLSWWSLPGEEDWKVIREALVDMDAAHLIGRVYSELSGGEKQMVLLAGVLAQDTPVLLLDEPARALDIHHQATVFRKLRALAERGKTVCCVTHELNLAGLFAHHVCLMDQGRMRETGTPQAVLTAEQLRSSYGEDVRVIADPHSGLPVVIPHVEARS